MNLLVDAWAWLSTPAHWSGPSGIPIRLAEHIGIVLAALVIASAIALPVGIAVGHTRRGAGILGAVAGGARAIPTLGLLTLLGLWLGIGLEAPMIALIVLAIPSLLVGAYSGIQAIDPALPHAARAIGMSPRQVIFSVEVPLAAPVIIGGIRAAVLQLVATTTLAAYTANAGLGRYLFTGLKSRDYPQMLGGALIVIALSIVFELLFAAARRSALTSTRKASIA